MRTASVLALAAFAACGTDYQEPYPGDSPAVYVAKVKNILVGQPPTDEEIVAVTKDPTALGGLVDGWMATPEYQRKMMVFFELAFQQTQISQADFVDMIPPNGIGTGRGIPQLIGNVRESFARTALALDAEGRPLTDAFTTKRLMMTPALMELYAFLDTRRVDDAVMVTDRFAQTHRGMTITMETSAGPIRIEDSVNPASASFLHFYTPDLPNQSYPDSTCNGLDPITFPAGSLSLHDLLYGEIPNHKSPTNANCANRPGTAMGV